VKTVVIRCKVLKKKKAYGNLVALMLQEEKCLFLRYAGCPTPDDGNWHFSV